MFLSSQDFQAERDVLCSHVCVVVIVVQEPPGGVQLCVGGGVSLWGRVWHCLVIGQCHMTVIT